MQTLVKFKKSKKVQYQFKERCSTQSRIASPRLVQEHNKGIIAFPSSRKQILSRAQGSKRIKGRHEGVKNKNKSLARNQGNFNQCKYD